jgi:hypothetical protein
MICQLDVVQNWPSRQHQKLMNEKLLLFSV